MLKSDFKSKSVVCLVGRSLKENENFKRWGKYAKLSVICEMHQSQLLMVWNVGYKIGRA